jgi:DNA-binding IclR family transcriptional regulator
VSASQTRVLQLIRALQGRCYQGLRLRDIAAAVEQAAPTTLRDLQAMEAEGFAERIPGRDDCWRLGPALVRIAHAHTDEVARLRQQVDDHDQRYTRTPL